MSKEITITDMGLVDSAGYKNIIAIRDYSKSTREEVRKLEGTIRNFEIQNMQLSSRVTMLEQQIQTLYNNLI
jgi:predicted RNase H-like nuclease (RuvC/YqgF family)|tara:strand:- start:487 stop:702 length:216 start_codon:yes stop_codon:yes gene_type:complete